MNLTPRVCVGQNSTPKNCLQEWKSLKELSTIAQRNELSRNEIKIAYVTLLMRIEEELPYNKPPLDARNVLRELYGKNPWILSTE